MKKNYIFGCVIVLTIALIFGVFLFSRQPSIPQQRPESEDVPNIVASPLDATYTIEGNSITLKNGISEKDIPDSSTKIKTTVFDQPVNGDMDKDGVDDFAVMLTYEPGGSGTFYYVAVALKMKDGTYKGTNAVLLGDRIAPQNISIKDGVLMANYAVRKDGEPMTAAPSVGTTAYLTLTDGTLAAIKPAGAHDDLIVVDLPQPFGEISSPVTFRGRARGTWFFEASFPVVLVDWDGKIIAQGVATADSDWMTENFVPFHGTLEFETPSYGERGAIIFKKDNPSGLPEHDDALEIPVTFKK